MDVQYTIEQLNHLKTSSWWKILLEEIKKLISVEQEDINRPAGKELNREQRELLHEKQEAQKLVMEAYNKIINLPDTVIADIDGSWNFTTSISR